MTLGQKLKALLMLEVDINNLYIFSLTFFNNVTVPETVPFPQITIT